MVLRAFAVLCSIRGRSSPFELDSMAGIVRMLLASTSCMPYFEWVASGGNWSDGVSRDGASDVWLRRHGFRVIESTPFVFLFRLPLIVLPQIFQFL